MLKKLFALSLLPLLLAGCTATFTNLTPKQQVHNADNLYPVEVSFRSRQATLRWETIRPQIIASTSADPIPMHPTLVISNRWEGLIPVPPGTTTVKYHYKFDYLQNAFGPPQPNSASSPTYLLHIIE